MGATMSSIECAAVAGIMSAGFQVVLLAVTLCVEQASARIAAHVSVLAAVISILSILNRDVGACLRGVSSINMAAT